MTGPGGTSLEALHGVRRGFCLAFTPPPKLSLSDWADRHFRLSAGDPNQGQWRTLPYQREIMDAFTDDTVEEIWVKKSARVGFTKMLNACIAYYVAEDPCSIMLVQPTIEDAEGYSKEEIAPMIEDVPVLKAIAPEKKAKTSKETILHKVFQNKATLSMVGANSPRGFRRVSRRVVLFDEPNGYPPSAGAEGDQIALGKRRAEYFANRKAIGGSTPTVLNASRITREFENTDKRYRFVPCPHCGAFQVLKWGGPDLPYGFKWSDRDPQTTFYMCEAAGCVIEPKWQRWMDERGEWRATAPPKFTANGRRILGYHLWAAYSHSPNATWPQLVAEYLDVCHDPVKLQTWVNTVRGEDWDPGQGHEEKAQGMLARREAYRAQVPAGVALLLAGIDTQDDRLEVTVWGFGAEEECWMVAHKVIYGNLVLARPWDDLGEFLDTPWQHEAGVVMKVRGACIDTGGHFSKQANAFARRERRCVVIPTKGASTRLPKPVKRSGKKARLWLIDTITMKDTIFARLAVKEPGPSFLHFPMETDREWFEQLTSERPKTMRVNGQDRRVYVPVVSGARNEALDCTVGAFAMLEILYPRDQQRTLVAPAVVEAPKAPEPPHPMAEVPPGRPKIRLRPKSGRGGGGPSWA